MLKMVFCLRRNPEMSREEFVRYWHDNHAPLVEKTLEPFGLRRYVLATTIDSDLNAFVAASRGTPPAYDGVAELWFDGPEVLVEGMASPEGMAASALLLEDEARFIDLANSPLFLAEERVIIESS
jgi:uncharacterized protein (TIGR02118 family)